MKSCFRNFLVIFLLLFSGCVTNTVTDIELDPNFLKQEYILLADEYFSLSQYDKALDLLLKANAINTDNALDYKIARTSALAKEWEISLKYYNALLEKDPENVAIKKSIAWVYAQSGALEKSLELYEVLYAEHTYDSEIVNNLVLLLVALDSIDKAEIIVSEYASVVTDDKLVGELTKTIEDSQLAKSE